MTERGEEPVSFWKVVRLFITLLLIAADVLLFSIALGADDPNGPPPAEFCRHLSASIPCPFGTPQEKPAAQVKN